MFRFWLQNLDAQTETDWERIRRRIAREFRVNLNTLTGFVPILQWLPKYNWRSGLLPDVVSGVTIGSAARVEVFF